METLQKKTKQELFNDSVEGMKPMLQDLIDKGWSSRRIDGLIRKIYKSKVRDFYREDFVNLSNVIKESIVDKFSHSKAERIFYFLLQDAGIKFQFQYKIGPYQADYLIGETLIIELDGPQHNVGNAPAHDKQRDKYLEKMGYTIFRIPLMALIMDKSSVIEEIQDSIHLP